MNRKQELLQLINNNIALIPLIDEMIYLENQLDYLRDLPKLVVNPKNPAQQRTTPATRLYKELLQQYTNIIRILLRITDTESDAEESPLRTWIKARLK